MKTDQELDQAIARLPGEIQPEQDLWLTLEARLPERHSRRRLPVGLAAGWSAAAALVVMVVVAWQLWLPSTSQVPQLANTDGPESLPAQYQLALEYENLKAVQLQNIGSVSPDYGNWQFQLAVWDQAIGQVSEALDYYPDDLKLLAQMQGLYTQQHNYLQMISAVDMNDYSFGDEL